MAGIIRFVRAVKLAEKRLDQELMKLFGLNEAPDWLYQDLTWHEKSDEKNVMLLSIEGRVLQPFQKDGEDAVVRPQIEANFRLFRRKFDQGGIGVWEVTALDILIEGHFRILG